MKSLKLALGIGLFCLSGLALAQNVTFPILKGDYFGQPCLDQPLRFLRRASFPPAWPNGIWFSAPTETNCSTASFGAARPPF